MPTRTSMPSTRTRSTMPSAKRNRDGRAGERRNEAVPTVLGSRPGTGQRRDARTDVHRQPGDVVAPHLDLARVNADPHLDAEHPHRVDDVVGKRDRCAGTHERHKESVAGPVPFTSAETPNLSADQRVVPVEQIAPSLVTQR